MLLIYVRGNDEKRTVPNLLVGENDQEKRSFVSRRKERNSELFHNDLIIHKITQ